MALGPLDHESAESDNRVWEQTNRSRLPLLCALGVLAGVFLSSGCQPLTGEGTESSTHSVALSWNASSSSVVGYNIYRGTQSGGPYPTRLNSSVLASTAYLDAAVQSGNTYYYVATAVDSNNVESSYSNEASATIP